MAQMTVIFEWPDDKGPRWFNQDELERMVSNEFPTSKAPLKIKSITYPNSTPKQRAQEEFHQLCFRMDTLSALSYKDFMALNREARDLLSTQYEAMTQYRETILARIEAWTDETS